MHTYRELIQSAQSDEATSDRFRLLAEKVPLAVVGLSSAGEISYVNDVFREWTSLAVGDHFDSAVHPDDLAAFEAHRDADREAEITDVEIRIRREGDGDFRATRCMVVARCDEHGAVVEYVACLTDIFRSSELERQARYEATRDAMTGLLARSAVTEELAQRLRGAEDRNTAVFFVDVDRFKDINDGHGHAVGDEVLRVVSERLQRSVRSTDALGRYGGDEFLIVSATGPGVDEALALAHRLVRDVNQPITVGSLEFRVRVSVGVAVATAESNTSMEELLIDADLAMYEAKRSSRSVEVAGAAIRHEAQLRAAVGQDLRKAMDEREVCFHYQPIRHLGTGEILGVEALIRWEHPSHGLIPAMLIIDAVETGGMAAKFTEWSLDLVCSDLAEMRERLTEFADKAVSFNLAPWQLKIPNYSQIHLAVLAKHGLRPADVIVEVTESSVIDVGRSAERTLQELTEHGVIIALDDFGVGFNAFSYFTRFPIHAIKVDRSLMEAAPRDVAATAIVRGLVQIARDLGIVILGEGIETEDEVQAAIGLGITQGQGYLLGWPMTMESIAAQEENGMHWMPAPPT